MAVPATLADLTFRTASELGVVLEGSATSASATLLIDTIMLTQSADYWNGGAWWVLNGSQTGQMGRVGDYTVGTITATGLSGTVASGDDFAVAKRRYPYYLLVQKVNEAYRELGQIPAENTALTTVAGQREYAIPAIVKYDVREIWIQTDNTDSDSNDWMRLPQAYQLLSTLYIPDGLPEDYTIKLVYIGEPARLDLATDAISSFIHPNRIVYKACAKILMWHRRRVGARKAQLINQDVNYFLDLDNRAKYEFPHQGIKQRSNKIVTWSSVSTADDAVPAPASA